MEKFKDIFLFAPKSKLKAGNGLEKGRFPFYTSSLVQNKWVNTEQYFDEALIIGSGGSASIHHESQPFATSTDCFVTISVRKNVNTKYVYYYLLANIQVLEKGFKGAGLKHIAKKYIEEIEVPLPEFEMQNKIVAILDKAKAILDKREESIRIYNGLLSSLFLQMFGDPCSPDRQDFSRLKTVIPEVISGWSPVCEETPRSNSGQPAILKQGSVSKRFFDEKQNKLLPKNLQIKKAVYAERGNLLLSRKNTPELVGAAAYIFQDYENLLLPDTIFNLRYDVGKVSGVYLYFLFNDIGFRKKIQKISVGQAKSMSNISQERLLQLKIPIPVFGNQKKFEEIVFKSYYSIYAKFLQSKESLEQLLKSLFQQLFSERITIDIDTELEALIKTIDLEKSDEENSIYTIINDIIYTQRLVDRHNNQDFKTRDQYDKARYILFRVMKEEVNLIKQVFKNNKIQLTLQNETAALEN